MRVLALCSLALVGCVTESTGRDDEALRGAAEPPPLGPPRLIAPMSSTHATTKLPTLSWELGRASTGARVELCADRACSAVLGTFVVDGDSMVPPEQLPDGVIFWRVTGLVGQGLTTAPSATWQFWASGMLFPQPGLAGPPVDTTYSSVLDVNGDGYADLAVSAPGSGLVHLYLGGAGGVPDVPSQTLTGPPGYGASLASAGDVDGDGYADLAIGTSGAPGAVEVRYGSAQALGARLSVLDPHGVSGSFGAQLATSMDVEGDGYGDLLVSGLERAQVYRGGPAGIAATPAYALLGDNAVDATQPPDATALTGGGDVNGDRHPDAVIRGYAYLGNGSGFTLQATGRFDHPGYLIGDNNGDGRSEYAGYFVHAGRPEGLSHTHAWGGAGIYMFGAAGDTNADGFNEVTASLSSLTGLPPWRVYFGNPLEDTGGPQRALELPGGVPTFEQWAAAGDLDGDAREDLAVGVPADGAVYLFMASPRLPSIPTRTLTGPGDGFGTAVE